MSEEIIEWIKLPHDLQHKFLELAHREAEELAPKLIELERHVRTIGEEISTLFKSFGERNDELLMASVDSSRSPRLSERLGMKYGVIASGVVYVKGVEKRDEEFAAGIFKKRQALAGERSKYYFDLLSSYIERKQALNVLDKCDLLILDGSFYGFVYTAQEIRKSGLYGKDEEEKIKEMFEITMRLVKSGKVISVIKRSHTRALGGYFSVRKKIISPLTKVIDKLILAYLMPSRNLFNYEGLIGEEPVQVYTQISSILSSRKDFSDIMDIAKEKVYAPFKSFGIKEEVLKELRRIQVKFNKNLPPCEFEIPRSMSLEKFIEIISQRSFFNEATNLPLALDLVDSLISIPSKFTEEFVSEIEGRILESFKEKHEILRFFFSLMNPQKQY